MEKLPVAERQILIAVQELIQKKKTPNHEALEKIGDEFFEKELVNWSGAFESLIQKGLLRREDQDYSLTKEGELCAKRAYAEYSSKGFGDAWIRSEQSSAHGILCQRLHGKNLCQFNMMDMEQLHELLRVLALDEDHRVLDLGCGIGTVTEFISDVTRAHVTGIDFAAKAIERAQERTQGKRYRLTFSVGDMNNLEFPANTFDAIIAIDTLYFVDDLKKTVEQMKSIGKQGGQMGIFFTQMLNPEESRDMLLPDNTKLASALSENRLNFQTWNFTESERRFWSQRKEILEQLKSDFEREGNLDLYTGEVKETESVLNYVESGRISRYLYHVRLKETVVGKS